MTIFLHRSVLGTVLYISCVNVVKTCLKNIIIIMVDVLEKGLRYYKTEICFLTTATCTVTQGRIQNFIKAPVQGLAGN